MGNVVHHSFTVERRYNATPTRVFAAWSSAEQKSKWFHGGEERSRDPLKLDFRVGGRERASGVTKSGVRTTYEALYLNIIPDERIILTYWMDLDGRAISTSMQTVEFKADGGGTRLTFTEQDVFLDGFDGPQSREHGTKYMLENLAHALGEQKG